VNALTPAPACARKSKGTIPVTPKHADEKSRIEAPDDPVRQSLKA
jgi:hypothetical protein